MSKQDTDDGDIQNLDTGDSGADSEKEQEPYRVFETEDELGKYGSQRFRDGYSDGQKKVQKDLMGRLKEAGVEADDLDTAIQSILESRGEDKASPEAEELRGKVQDFKSKYEQTLEELNSVRMSNKMSKERQKAFNEILNGRETIIDQSSIESLYSNEVEIKDEDGTLVPYRNGTPELDGEGNRKTVAQSMADFAVSKKFAKPAKQGVGGSTGDAPASEKPKFADFKALINSSKAGDKEKAGKLYNKAMSLGGWADK